MSDDGQVYADRIAAAYDAEARWPPEGVEVPEAFWYLHFKAFTFLRVGPEEYRSYDALNQPPTQLPSARLHAIKRGCEQILRFCGISADRPLEDIGVDGFYALLRTFHFSLYNRAVLSTGASGIVLDRMTMRHVVDDREVTLYNLVAAERRADAKSDGAPCPYCGELLRTAFAKQCRHCGMDWHDPANVVNRKTAGERGPALD